MGKTAQGAVWLNAELLSPYEYWQFWRNTADADVGRFLRLFTDLPMDEVARLDGLSGADINQAKIVLATEATTMLHGADAAKAAEQTARQTFEGGGTGENLPKLSVGDGMNIAHALTALGFTPSNKEAKRKIAEGAVRLDDKIVSDASLMVSAAEEPLKLSLGRKRHGLLVRKLRRTSTTPAITSSAPAKRPGLSGSRGRPRAPTWSSHNAMAIWPAMPMVIKEARPIFGAA
jgi:tyrosyl-tRNA synthetase